MSLEATGRLLRFHLRRDRLMLVWWTVGGAVLYWSQGVSVKGLYATQAEFDRAAASMAHNAAFIAMAGPARALNTIGGQVAWQASAFGAVVAGLMSMFLVGRHTRAEEESGRAELVLAGVVGRHGPVAAAALVVLVANVLFCGLVTASLVGYGLAAAGSVSLGLAAGLAGLVFGATALVAAQLTESTRATYGITGVVLATSYVLRAVGDVGNGALSWLSPIGWGQAMHAFSGERWWPALLSVAAVVVLGVAALALLARRDVGGSLWATRPGPARAPGSLLSPLGLTWRQQRAGLAAWAGGLLLTGLAYGAIGKDVKSLLGDSQLSQDIFTQGGGSLVDSFYAVAAMMLALLTAGFSVSSALRARSEEDGGRVEALLATAVPRWRWAGAQLVVTLGGTVLVLAAGGLGMGLGFTLVTGDGSAVARLLGATLAYLAPVLVLVGVTWLVYGLAPRWATAGWLALGFCVVVLFFGQALRFPSWLVDLSPFSHVALVPAESFAPGPTLAVLGAAVLLAAAGVAAFRRRDLTG